MSRYSYMENLGKTLNLEGYFSHVEFPPFNERDPKIKLRVQDSKESIAVGVGVNFTYNLEASVSSPHMWVPLHLATERCLRDTFTFNVPKVNLYSRLANLTVYAVSHEQLQVSENDAEFQVYSQMVKESREANHETSGSPLLDILMALINPFD